MLILNAEEVRKALPMAQVIEAMKKGYAALSGGRAEVPLRARLPVPPQEAVSLFMPAFVEDEEEQALAVKIVSVFPKNPAKGLPTIYAAVLALNPETGEVLAVLEGGTLTAIRTGAGSGAATDLLARTDSHTAAIFGAGVQARTQLEAVCSIRRIEKAWVYDPKQENAENFISEMAGQGHIPTDLQLAASPKEAVREADIICTATTSTRPVFDFSDLKAGAHINAVGSYTPEMQEVPAALIQEAMLVVDSRSACLAETGDLLTPIAEGLVDEQVIHAELGEIVLGKKSGREGDSQFTYFKSVGVAVQDAMAGQLALKNADAMGLGQQIDW